MPKKTDWRHGFDKIIPAKIKEAGFHPYNGAAYTFDVTDEIVGLIFIQNNILSKALYADKAHIICELGVIHWQFAEMCWRLEGEPNATWSAELRDVVNDQVGNSAQFVTERNEDEMGEFLSTIVNNYKTRAVPYVLSELSTLDSIVQYLKSHHSDQERLCVGLVLNNQIEEAEALFEGINSDLENSTVHKPSWRVWAPKFEKWREDGYPVAGLAEAKKSVQDRAEAVAEKRRKSKERPTSYYC